MESWWQEHRLFIKALLQSGFVTGKNSQDIIFNSLWHLYSLPTKLPFVLVGVRPTVHFKGTVPTMDHLTPDISCKFRKVPQTALGSEPFLQGCTDLVESYYARDECVYFLILTRGHIFRIDFQERGMERKRKRETLM